jgi:hypothetical protein
LQGFSKFKKIRKLGSSAESVGESGRSIRDLLGLLAILPCRFVVASAFFECVEEIRADPRKPLQSGS